MANNNTPLIVGGAIAGVLLTPVVAPIALGALGFGAAGPIAGYLAPVIQSWYGGNIAAGSLFAICQSVGMGGAIPTAFSAIGAGVGAVIGSRVRGEGGGGDGGGGGGGDDDGGNGGGGDGGDGGGGDGGDDGSDDESDDESDGGDAGATPLGAMGATAAIKKEKRKKRKGTADADADATTAA